MTEQWQELKETITEMCDNSGTGTQQEVCKFLANYMEILEKQMKQPCDDDCISRDDVLTNLRLNWRLYESAEDAIKMSIYDVSNMDSINPKQAKVEIEKEEPAKDCISRAEALRHRHIVYDDDGIGHSVVRVDEIMALPSVTPKAKTGHWIEKEDYNLDIYYDCSECGESFCLIDGTPTDNLYNYCPNCGSKMTELKTN